MWEMASYTAAMIHAYRPYIKIMHDKHAIMQFADDVVFGLKKRHFDERVPAQLTDKEWVIECRDFNKIAGWICWPALRYIVQTPLIGHVRMIMCVHDKKIEEDNHSYYVTLSSQKTCRDLQQLLIDMFPRKKFRMLQGSNPEVRDVAIKSHATIKRLKKVLKAKYNL